MRLLARHPYRLAVDAAVPQPDSKWPRNDATTGWIQSLRGPTFFFLPISALEMKSSGVLGGDNFLFREAGRGDGAGGAGKGGAGVDDADEGDGGLAFIFTTAAKSSPAALSKAAMRGEVSATLEDELLGGGLVLATGAGALGRAAASISMGGLSPVKQRKDERHW